MGFSATKKGSFRDLNLLFQINDKINTDFEYEKMNLGDYEMIFPLRVFDPDQGKDIFLPSPNFPVATDSPGNSKSPSRKPSE